MIFAERVKKKRACSKDFILRKPFCWKICSLMDLHVVHTGLKTCMYNSNILLSGFCLFDNFSHICAGTFFHDKSFAVLDDNNEVIYTAQSYRYI